MSNTPGEETLAHSKRPQTFDWTPAVQATHSSHSNVALFIVVWLSHYLQRLSQLLY